MLHVEDEMGKKLVIFHAGRQMARATKGGSLRDVLSRALHDRLKQIEKAIGRVANPKADVGGYRIGKTDPIEELFRIVGVVFQKK
jgi:hypothetical protein